MGMVAAKETVLMRVKNQIGQMESALPHLDDKDARKQRCRALVALLRVESAKIALARMEKHQGKRGFKPHRLGKARKDLELAKIQMQNVCTPQQLGEYGLNCFDFGLQDDRRKNWLLGLQLSTAKRAGLQIKPAELQLA